MFLSNLVWFRSDLRVADNPALYHAAQNAHQKPLAVYLLTPEQWRRHDWGAPKVDFLLRNLQKLGAALQSRGIPLLVEQEDTFAGAPRRLLEIARNYGCDALYFNREYEYNETRRDQTVADLFSSAGFENHAFDDQTVLPPSSVKTQAGRPYSVFTPYRRAWLREVHEEAIPDLYTAPAPAGVSVPSPPKIPDSLAGFEASATLIDLWPAGEDTARRRLQLFIEQRTAGYDRQRDTPCGPGTSHLSPYLALGVLSVRECLLAAVAANQGRLEGGSPGISKWIDELIWREFYRHVLVGFPRIGKGEPFRPQTEGVPWRRGDEEYEAWRSGRTGIPFIDAGMRQLLTTGWMHNRLRMLSAVFLTKHLLIDWRRGERHFARHLVDLDFANNNGGWQWAASTGTDSVPYFRIFNPWLQSRRYDPEGSYIRRWVNELSSVQPAAVLHDPRGLTPEERTARAYPPPLVEHPAARRRALNAFHQAHQ